jgi:hypothetical protein
MRKGLAALTVSLALAACGGSSNHSGNAASCLANLLAQQAQGISAPSECFTGSSGSGPLSALCTQQSAEQYACQVTASGNANGFNFEAEAGSYEVSYDGNSLSYTRVP